MFWALSEKELKNTKRFQSFFKAFSEVILCSMRPRQNNHNFSESSDSRRQLKMLSVNEFRLVLCLKSVVNVSTFDVIRLKSQLLWKCDQATYSGMKPTSESVCVGHFFGNALFWQGLNAYHWCCLTQLNTHTLVQNRLSGYTTESALIGSKQRQTCTGGNLVTKNRLATNISVMQIICKLFVLSCGVLFLFNKS